MGTEIVLAFVQREELDAGGSCDYFRRCALPVLDSSVHL